MHCYTLNVDGELARGIRIRVSDERSESPCPGILLGGQKVGVTIPISEDWFHRIQELDQQALALPELKDCSLQLPLILNADLEEEKTDVEGEVRLTLVSRPGNETDRRVLLRIVPPEEGKVRYTGCYKVERLEGTKVVRNYPKLGDVVGVELLADVGGEAALILQPGAAFRINRPRGHNPEYHMYRLTTSGSRPRLINLPTRKSDRAA